MIGSFADKEAERIFNRFHSRKFAARERVIFRKLRLLEAASTLSDLQNPPGNRLEALKHSIRINDQWRICFEWREGYAYEIEIVDYHWPQNRQDASTASRRDAA